MENKEQGFPADLLAKATALPGNIRLEAFDPMENIPTLGVGAGIEPGMTISGYFAGTEVVASPKFTYSQTRNEAGIPTQLRHRLRVGTPTGPMIGIWNAGELKVGFEKLREGDFVSLTYKGKGKNAKGQDQHNFEWKKALPTEQ